MSSLPPKPIEPTEPDRKQFYSGKPGKMVFNEAAYDEAIERFEEEYRAWEEQMEGWYAIERQQRMDNPFANVEIPEEEPIRIPDRAKPSIRIEEEEEPKPAPKPVVSPVRDDRAQYRAAVQQAIAAIVRCRDEAYGRHENPGFGFSNTAEYKKQMKQTADEIEKITIHCDYKERIQLSTAEEKKVDALKALIATVDAKLEAREKQLTDSQHKIQRLDDQIQAAEQKYEDDKERLRAEFDAKMRALDTRHKNTIDKLELEKRKSESYVGTVRGEVLRLENEKSQHASRIDAKTKPTITLTRTDYTKLRTLKTKVLEPKLAELEQWYKSLAKLDDRLRTAVETYYDCAFHKATWEDDFPNLRMLEDIYDYNYEHSKHRDSLMALIQRVNRLLENADTTPDSED